MDTKDFYKYGIELSLTEYHDNENITSKCIFQNFEILVANNLLKTLENFNKNLKTYLVQQNLIKEN